jgi:hypothetical protein
VTPAPCAAPPTLPCRPDCRGWVVDPRTGLIEPCAACEHWSTSDEGINDVLQHMQLCRACADLAVLAGAREPIVAVFAGIHYRLTEGGWVATVYASRAEVVSTAAYPTREDAREAGMAWLRRLRGQPW